MLSASSHFCPLSLPWCLGGLLTLPDAACSFSAFCFLRLPPHTGEVQ